MSHADLCSFVLSPLLLYGVASRSLSFALLPLNHLEILLLMVSFVFLQELLAGLG